MRQIDTVNFLLSVLCLISIYFWFFSFQQISDDIDNGDMDEPSGSESGDEGGTNL